MEQRDAGSSVRVHRMQSHRVVNKEKTTEIRAQQIDAAYRDSVPARPRFTGTEHDCRRAAIIVVQRKLREHISTWLAVFARTRYRN